MKKITAILLTLMLILPMLAGCTTAPVVISQDALNSSDGESSHNTTSKPNDTNSGSGEHEEMGKDSNAVKTGLAIVTGTQESVDAEADKVGAGKFDVTLAAVTVDDRGVIDSCRIDSIGSTIDFDNQGVITSDLTADVLTKNELGDAYGMKQGGAKYEWNEQAAALANYAEGKTLEELKKGAVGENGMAVDEDLASMATIYLGGYVAAIEEAVQNAEHKGAQKGDILKLASISTLENSTNAAEDAEGTAQLDCDVTALTMKENVITSCVLDSVQAAVKFDAAGKITNDITGATLTKNQLGEAYGMKRAGAKYEWYEQAASFASYVTDKTAAEVSNIAVDERTAPADADLASSVTIAIGGFMELIEKAAQ